MKVNDKVTVHPQLTTDPKNKQGSTGVVTEIHLDVATVRFKDNTKGFYCLDALITN